MFPLWGDFCIIPAYMLSALAMNASFILKPTRNLQPFADVGEFLTNKLLLMLLPAIIFSLGPTTSVVHEMQQTLWVHRTLNQL